MAVAAEARPRVRRRRNLLEQPRFLAPVLIAPAVIFIVLLVGGPLIMSVYLSLTNATAGALHGDWVGFENFTNEWRDPNFQTALKNTLFFTVMANAVVVVGAAFLSHFLVRDFRGKWIVRFLVLLPWAAPVALVAPQVPQLERERHVVERGHVRIERVVLEDHRDVAVLRG